jgi:hypothetical protein
MSSNVAGGLVSAKRWVARSEIKGAVSICYNAKGRLLR